MDNRPKDLKLHKLLEIKSCEPSTKYAPKYVAEIKIQGVERGRFFISEKQARSLDRVAKKAVKYVVLNHAAEKGPYFVFASDDPTWLLDVFINPKAEGEEKLAPVTRPAARPAPRPIVQEAPIEFSEQDLPF